MRARFAALRPAASSKTDAVFTVLKPAPRGAPARHESASRGPRNNLRPPALLRTLPSWLADKPALRELWTLKAAIYRLYRILGHARAERALVVLLNQMAGSSLPEDQTLRTTPLYGRHALAALRAAARRAPPPIRLKIYEPRANSGRSL